METLKWSKSQIDRDFAGCQALGEMIAHIEKKLAVSQQVVCQVRVNDMLLIGKDEQKFADTPIADIQTLEITYRNSEFLLRDSLQSLMAWLAEFNHAILNAADEIRSADMNSTAYSFTRVVSSAEWFIDALQAVKAHILVTPEWAACEERFVKALKELETGYTAQDNILVADVLEYEVSSCLDQWREILSKVTPA